MKTRRQTRPQSKKGSVSAAKAARRRGGVEIDAALGHQAPVTPDRTGSPSNGTDELELSHKVEQLQEALHSRIEIEQAKGVLAERFRLSIDEAFALLRYSARATRTSLHALAHEVIVAGETTPEAVVTGLVKSKRWYTPSRVEAESE